MTKLEMGIELENGYQIYIKSECEEIKTRSGTYYIPGPEIVTIKGTINRTLVCWLRECGHEVIVHEDHFGGSYIQTKSADVDEIAKWLDSNVLSANPSVRGGFGRIGGAQ